mmetsp:Transcript_41311/g.106925  ORF Transcript_41311/g.106925 Transcript_41311/m.106925 type:complete len:196 (-) Transcript_41311:1100-1687(-)
MFTLPPILHLAVQPNPNERGKTNCSLRYIHNEEKTRRGKEKTNLGFVLIYAGTYTNEKGKGDLFQTWSKRVRSVEHTHVQQKKKEKRKEKRERDNITLACTSPSFCVSTFEPISSRIGANIALYFALPIFPTCGRHLSSLRGSVYINHIPHADSGEEKQREKCHAHSVHCLHSMCEVRGVMPPSTSPYFNFARAV